MNFDTTKWKEAILWKVFRMNETLFIWIKIFCLYLCMFRCWSVGIYYWQVVIQECMSWENYAAWKQSSCRCLTPFPWWLWGCNAWTVSVQNICNTTEDSLSDSGVWKLTANPAQLCVWAAWINCFSVNFILWVQMTVKDLRSLHINGLLMNLACSTLVSFTRTQRLWEWGFPKDEGVIFTWKARILIRSFYCYHHRSEKCINAGVL